jgi:hypothetical protein
MESPNNCPQQTWVNFATVQRRAGRVYTRRSGEKNSKYPVHCQTGKTPAHIPTNPIFVYECPKGYYLGLLLVWF